MRTVSSLCASSSVTSLAVVGLAVARGEHTIDARTTDYARPEENMTAVARYSFNTALDIPTPYRPTTTTSSLRPLSKRNDVASQSRSSSSSNSQPVSRKRRSTLVPSGDFGAERMEASGDGEEHDALYGAPSSVTRPAWLRRLSSSIGTSRESSRAPSPYTNGSISLSHAGSATPMFAGNIAAAPAMPQNKLVKRSTSLHQTPHSLSPSPGPASRLPMPKFRRPATSHERCLRERFPGSDVSPHGEDVAQWRHYFTPRVDIVEATAPRSHSSIPNPIRRIYPDRKYTPVLLSTKDSVRPAATEVDPGCAAYEDACEPATPPVMPSSASSPFPQQPVQFPEAPMPRRAYSIGNMTALQSSTQHSSWRRPLITRGNVGTLRRSRPRVLSAPQVPMGNRFSHVSDHESERPAKRRDLADDSVVQRSIYSSGSNPAGSTDAPTDIDLGLGTEASPLQFTPDHSLFVQPAPSTRPSSSDGHSRVFSAPSSSSFPAKHARLSATQSEVTSTVGSDSEYRSLGDNSTDYQSDNAYDSIQTRTTRSSSGRRGPHIETIFDESPSAFSSGRSTKLKDFLNDGHFATGDHGERFRHSTIEEEESVASTPVRSVRNKSVASTPSARPIPSQIFSSSPPFISRMPDPDDMDWDGAEDDPSETGLGIRQPFSASTIASASAERTLPFRLVPSLWPNNSRSSNSTPQRSRASPLEKTNLFDWSEQQPSPSHPNRSPPRPRTVHGKKDQDSRGSRPAGRRPVSGMHARSHSVPVVPDVDGKRHNVVANKFGTWGVGSKAVTEDWNEDFEFDEAPLSSRTDPELDEQTMENGRDMIVPRSIREQQENVVANIGLLREWGLLIEELKELRIRAVALDMMRGPYAQAWREIDAMIELADQETEEHTLEPRRSPPSSPGFDYSAFDDSPPRGGRTDGHSQLSAESSDEFEPGALNLATIRAPFTLLENSPVVSRPRKDSELVAQRVIAALQSKRHTADLATVPVPGARKVPFDTATLRHIVPYVNGLKRKAKDALRETEGLYSSPHRRGSPAPRGRHEQAADEIPFRNIFKAPYGPGIQQSRHARRARAATDHDDNEAPTETAEIPFEMQNIDLQSHLN